MKLELNIGLTLPLPDVPRDGHFRTQPWESANIPCRLTHGCISFPNSLNCHRAVTPPREVEHRVPRLHRRVSRDETRRGEFESGPQLFDITKSQFPALALWRTPL